MEKEFESLFVSHAEPVVVLREQKPVYRNPAAGTLFSDGNLTECLRRLADIQKDGGDGDRMVTSLPLNGRTYRVTAAPFCGYRVLRFEVQQPESGNACFLEAVSSAIRSAASVFQMASHYVIGQNAAADDEKYQRYLAMMNHSFYTVSRLTNQIARLGESLSGDVRLEKSVFNLADLCRTLMESVSIYTKDKGVSFSFATSCAGLLVSADPEKLELALLCLLSNSLKYTPEGGSIRLTVKQADGQAVLTMSDTGCGMAPQELAGVFEKYRQPHRMDDPKAGAGVGLLYVRHVAQAHGGTLVVESREDRGTSVVLSIPVTRDNPPVLKSGHARYEPSGNHLLLTELSDVLDSDCYLPRYLD